MPGLVALTGVLITAAAGSAAPLSYGVVQIKITPAGLSPPSVRVKAEHVLPVWINEDSISHTLSFDEGCKVTVAAGSRHNASCGGRLLKTGTHRYQINELPNVEGQLVVVPNERRVTLRSSRREARVGQPVTFSGTIVVENIAFSPPYGQTITLLRRNQDARRFVPIERVVCLPRSCRNYAWSITLRPTATATYVARIQDKPGSVIWERADSAKVVVQVNPTG